MITLEGVPPSSELFERIEKEKLGVIVNFSRGKDSLTVWNELEARGLGKQIQEVIHLSPIPGSLQFITDDLKRYEDHFQRRIIDMPAYGFFRQMANNIYQAPERCAIMEAAQIPVITREEWDAMIRESYGTKDTWFLDGVRAADSATRRMHIKSHGAVQEKGKRMSVIWDFQIQDIRDSIARGGIELGIDYEWYGRSYDGLRHDYVAVLKEKAPEDYARLLRWYPMLEAEVKRGQVVGKDA